MNLLPINLKPMPTDFKLREAQEIAEDMVRAEFRKGKKSVTVHLAPGCGKTILSGYLFRLTLIKNPEAMCIFVVPRTTLLVQTKEVFEEIFGFDVGIIRANDEQDLTCHIQVATIQSLTNRLNSKNYSVADRFNGLPVKMVAIDENHLQFKGLDDIKSAWAPYLIGLSGSPFSKGMGLNWESLVRPKTMVQLMADGIITDYRVRACVPINRSNLRTSSTGEYVEKSLEEETTKIIGDICKEYMDSEDMRARKVIGFAPSIATCIALSDEFVKAGVRSVYVHSFQNEDDVQAIIDAFKAGHYEIVWSVIKLCEGLDVPEVSGIIDATAQAPSKHDKNLPNSAARLLQKVSRGLRSFKGKTECLIHCHSGNYLQYGPYELLELNYPTLDMGKKSVKPLDPSERMERAVRECPACHMAVKVTPCPYCGEVPKKPSQWLDSGDLDFIEGKMIEVKKTAVKPKKKPASREDKIKFSSMLKYKLNKVRDKNPQAKIVGMFYFKYLARFGVGPVGDFQFNSVEPIAPDDGFNAWYTSQNIRYAKRKSA